ncbi:hypothetical protein [Streptomyces sp. NPDC088733]|uniref:phage tail protein n=1 Tax=Streptomyces sp. NPDC088733 TaxID=3365880 RepID=UPI00381D6D55
MLPELAVLVPVLTTVIGWITKFTDILTKAVNWVVDKFKEMFDILLGHSIIPDLVNGIVHWFTSLWDKTKKIFTDLMNGVVSIWNSLWKSVRDRWNSFWSGLSGAVTGAWKWVRDSVSSLRTSVTNAWNGLWSGVSDKVTSIFSTIRGKVGDFKNSLTSTFSAPALTVQGFVKAVWRDRSMAEAWPLMEYPLRLFWADLWLRSCLADMKAASFDPDEVIADLAAAGPEHVMWPEFAESLMVTFLGWSQDVHEGVPTLRQEVVGLDLVVVGMVPQPAEGTAVPEDSPLLPFLMRYSAEAGWLVANAGGTVLPELGHA